ncbi:MAG: hypothetical protein ABR83_02555, partial [Cryomorphaceae bacterium BACL18 MAG-120924-bin36]
MMKTRSILMVLALALSVAPAWAQGLITGSVKGEDGSPLPSAVIKEASTGATTVADGNGQYRLQVASKTASVSASLMGYVSQT